MPAAPAVAAPAVAAPVDAAPVGALAVPGRAVTVAVLLMSAMTIMANATISPSLPGLREHYGGVRGIETLAGLLLTLPSLAIVLTAGLMGWLADKVDRQRLLVVSGALYALGGTSGLWVDGIGAMLAGRVVLGVGVAGTMILATTWAADLWQGEARQRYLGLQGAAMSAGGIVVILLGGALASLHWRGAFLAYLLVVPVMVVGVWALAPYARARAEAPRGPRAGGDGPGIPWRAFAFVGPLAFLFMTAFYVMPTRLPFRLAEMGVTSPLVTGLLMALMTTTSIPGALGYARLRRRLSVMDVFALSWTLMAAGMGLAAAATTLPVAALGIAVMGLGMGPSMPNYTTYWMGVVPPAVRGRASGLLTTAFFSGQFASPLVTAPLVASFGLAQAFGVLALVMAVLGVGLGVLAGTRRTALA
jgi:MFS family permease